MGSGKWVLENIGVAVDGLIELQSKDAILLVYGKKKTRSVYFIFLVSERCLAN